MSAKISMIGRRFSLLLVTMPDESNHIGKAKWICRCDCGNTISALGYSLRHGDITNCGCVKRERAKLMGLKNRTHGKTNTSEFHTWTAMISRCTNPKDPRYKRYGARGIKVCDRWLDSFEIFLSDVGLSPFAGAELDRRNNDGNYEPDNCRWVTSLVNNNNKSTCRYLTFNNITLSMTQWARRYGINPATLRMRLEAGWSVERAITQKTRGRVDMEKAA